MFFKLSKKKNFEKDSNVKFKNIFFRTKNNYIIDINNFFKFSPKKRIKLIKIL